MNRVTSAFAERTTVTVEVFRHIDGEYQWLRPDEAGSRSRGDPLDASRQAPSAAPLDSAPAQVENTGTPWIHGFHPSPDRSIVGGEAAVGLESHLASPPDAITAFVRGRAEQSASAGSAACRSCPLQREGTP